MITNLQEPCYATCITYAQLDSMNSTCVRYNYNTDNVCM